MPTPTVCYLRARAVVAVGQLYGFVMLFSNINLMNVLGFILEEYYIIIHIKY